MSDILYANCVEGEKKVKIKGIVIKVIIALVIFSSTMTIGTVAFFNTRFPSGTKINGIDCSLLTVNQAKSKINKQLQSSQITFKFANNEYKISPKDIDLRLESTEKLQDILNPKEPNADTDKREYELTNSFSFDRLKLEGYLNSVPEFTNKKVLSQNAYLNWNEKAHEINIVPEVIGNIGSVNEAFEIANRLLANGEILVDLTISPQILSTSSELVETKQNINKILKTTINYKLNDRKYSYIKLENLG